MTRDASSLAKGTQADSVEPPYLQIVCSQLWELDKNNPTKTLRLATYRKAGGAKGLLENYVNEVLKSFSDREKQITSKAFDHLISRRGTKMAHTPEDLAELVNRKPAELANVMDQLEQARILRRQQRDQQVWYELYHDMFSGGIETWNTAWKNHMRLRRTLIATAVSLAALATTYFGVIGYLQATSQHLRLGNKANDRVEIYTGSSKFPDPFGQQHYLSETGFERNQLELDKRYPKRDIPDYPLVVRDLIASQPIESRVSAYINNGDFCQFSDLLTQVLPLEKPAPGCKLPNTHPNSLQASYQTTDANLEKIATGQEIDGFLQQIMLQQLLNVKTTWAFEQIRALRQLSENNSNNLSIPDNDPFYTQPLAYLPEKALNQGFLQRSFISVDPRYVATSIQWALNPEQFQVIPSMRPAELMSMLIDSGDADTNAIFRNVLKALSLKPRLLQALTSENPQTREVAALLIGQTQDANFSNPLSKLLLDKIPNIHLTALKSLFQINMDQGIATAAELIITHNQPLDLRTMLILQLGDSNSLKAAPLLLARFQDPNEREEIRQMAALGLSSLGATEAIPAFRAALNDPNERTEVRTGAIEGLKSLNDLASIDLLLNRLQDIEERLDIRSACASALGLLAANQAAPTLLALIEHPDTEEGLKYAAISALSNLEDPSIIPRLTAYSKTISATTSLATASLEIQLQSTLDTLTQSEHLTINPINSELLKNLGQASSIPQYEPINKPTISFDSSVNSQLLGSYAQRQALHTAMSLSDDNRNPALLRIATDKSLNSSIRVQALRSLQPAQQNQTTHQILISLTKDPHHLIRTESIAALLRILEGEALLPWLNTQGIASTSLLTSLNRYVATSPRTQAISTLLRFAQDDQSPLQPAAYTLLAELKASEALPMIHKHLAILEEEYREWRQLRDQQPDDLSDAKAYVHWQTQFEAAIPKHAPLAIYYGYALAAMGFEQALTALNHDLADLRLGASFSLGKNASVQDLQTLAQERAKHPEKPLFQQASYLAINQGLQRLELSTDPKEIQALTAWHTHTKAPATDPVIQRLAWTLTLIKHYQSIDQEFASKYQLQRKSSLR